MSIVDRAKNILLSPRTEWPVIQAEPSTIQGIYRNYLVYLAAIPAIATLIGMSLIGFGMMGVSVRVPFTSGLANAILGYALTLGMIYVLALVVDALAPTFKGEKNQLAAFKLVAYGSTASLVSGIVYLLPSLGIIAILGALYSIYLFYVGLPVLMKCPPEKALPYTAVLLVCGFIASLIIGAISAMALPGHQAIRMGGGGPDIAIRTPQGEVTLNTSKMEEMARRMEEASKKMEQASKSGDSEAVGKAAADVFAALGGGQAREPMAPADLKVLLPESVAGLTRTTWEAQSGGAMGVKGSTASASYGGDGDRKVKLEIIDSGGLAGLLSVATWMNMTGERETPESVERVYKQGTRTLRERTTRRGSNEYTVVLQNGLVISAEGGNVDLPTLKKTVESIDLAKLEAVKGK